MREYILSCGGEIHFGKKVTAIMRNGNTITGIKAMHSNDTAQAISIYADAVILATGHSARDIFEMLYQNKISITSKPFALGVRIEHPQQLIDSIQYHCTSRNEFLPPAAYAFSEQVHNRGMYSFCMCPGGIIAPASTSPGELVVNGWSPSKRNNPYANSGLVISVDENDFKSFSKYGELRAMEFQKSVERAAFRAGGSNLTAPAVRLMDFLEEKISSSLPECSYIPGITPGNMDDIFPKPITLALREGLKIISKKMRGYATNEAVLVATESRTSSPVKIPRDQDSLMHPMVNGFFPCGEGAGYAGGIMSAAMDGERVAEKCEVFINSR
jgi:uncharacterized protein